MDRRDFYDPWARVTPDGRWVVFASDAPGPAPGPGEHPALNVYLWDRLTGSTTLVSHTAAGPTVAGASQSHAPRISDDGRWVAFASLAPDLVPGQVDHNQRPDLFLWDRTTGRTVLVSHAKGSPRAAGSLDSYGTPFTMSADGRLLAFVSAAEIEGIEPGKKGGLYLYDRTTGDLVRLSDQGRAAAISADDRTVLFNSYLEPGVETGGYDQVFLYDRSARTTTLLSRSISGERGGNQSSDASAISADGRYVALTSSATDLVPGQPLPPPRQLLASVFLLDRVAGTTTWVSAPGPATVRVPDASFVASLSASGRQLAFDSRVDLAEGDQNGDEDAYLFSLDPPPPPDAGPVAVPPCALFDGAPRSGARKTVKIGGFCGVPATASRAVVKVGVSEGTGAGNVQVYPGDTTSPSAGILRFNRGASRAATFTVPLAARGITLLPLVAGNGTVRVAVEVDGYVP